MKNRAILSERSIEAETGVCEEARNGVKTEEAKAWRKHLFYRRRKIIQQKAPRLLLKRKQKAAGRKRGSAALKKYTEIGIAMKLEEAT